MCCQKELHSCVCHRLSRHGHFFGLITTDSSHIAAEQDDNWRLIDAPQGTFDARVDFAIGRAYRFTLTGGEELNDEEFIAAGGSAHFGCQSLAKAGTSR